VRYILQAFLALVALIGLPMVLETPTSAAGIAASVLGALILAGLAFRGVIGFVNSRRPKRYLDSIMPETPPKK
jgi:hypothetical protein